VESYETIIGLVEEVRDILDLHEKKKPQKVIHHTKLKGGKRTARQKNPRKHGPLHHMTQKHLVKKHGAKTAHNPFKNLKKGKRLGPTVKKVAMKAGPSTKTPGKYRGYWRCRCHNYKCLCTATSEAGNEIKKVVRIDRGDKRKYNREYRKWRQKASVQKRYTGPKSKFRKKKAKPGDAHYHAD